MRPRRFETWKKASSRLSSCCNSVPALQHTKLASDQEALPVPTGKAFQSAGTPVGRPFQGQRALPLHCVHMRETATLTRALNTSAVLDWRRSIRRHLAQHRTCHRSCTKCTENLVHELPHVQLLMVPRSHRTAPESLTRSWPRGRTILDLLNRSSAAAISSGDTRRFDRSM